MKKLILFLLYFFSISCATYVDYYQPLADKGEVRRAYDQYGMWDTILFEPYEKISISLRCALVEPGACIELYLDIPEGVTVRFENNLFSIRDLLSEKVIEKQIFLARYHNDKGEKIEKDILNILNGGSEVYGKYRRYYIDVELPEFRNIKFESFILSCPAIEINGQQYKIPKVTFNKRSGWEVIHLAP